MVLLWGSNWTVMKVGLKFVSPLNFVMQRFFFASIALLPVLFWKKKNFPRDRKTWLKLFILSLIHAACITSTNIGLMYESSGLSSLFTYTQPLFVFCLAVPFLNERASVVRALGVIMGFSGVAILYAERISLTTNVLNPVPLLILGAFLWAVTVVYYKKFLSYVDPVLVNIVQFLTGCIFLFVATLMFEGLTFNDTALYLFAVLYVSILGSAIASTIWLLLIREEETIIVSTSSLIVPAVALIFGWIFLGEAVRVTLLWGFTLILVGICLVNNIFTCFHRHRASWDGKQEVRH